MRILLLITALLLSSGSLADNHGGADTKAAMKVLDEFMATFNARDINAWAQTLNYPHVRFASGSVAVYEDASAFTDRPVFDSLTATGWDHSHWISREVILSSPGKVHISTVFSRFNTDNEPIGTYQSLYIVTKVNGRWGIQARSSLAP